MIDLVLKGKSVFFTGAAGTGKSFLLKKLHQVRCPHCTRVAGGSVLAFFDFFFMRCEMASPLVGCFAMFTVDDLFV